MDFMKIFRMCRQRHKEQNHHFFYINNIMAYMLVLGGGPCAFLVKLSHITILIKGTFADNVVERVSKPPLNE